jgi:hypothetical protein
MSKGNNTLLYVGGAGLLAWLFLKPKTSALATNSTTPGQTLQPGDPYPFVIAANHPPVPTSWNYAYYLQYIYPAMTAANPNVANPNYQLSASELAQYLSNYSDLRGWLNSGIIPHPFANQNAALQSHWTHNGVAESRSFMPFLPTTTAPYTPPPANANTSGGGSWITDALKVAGTVVAVIAGTDGSTTVLLNDREAEVLIEGSDIGLEMLKFYYNETNGLALAIEEKNLELLKQYTQ